MQEEECRGEGVQDEGLPDSTKRDNDQQEYDKAPHILDPVGEIVDGVELPVYGHAHKVGDKGSADLYPCVLPDGVYVRLHSSHSCSAAARI